MRDQADQWRGAGLRLALEVQLPLGPTQPELAVALGVGHPGDPVKSAASIKVFRDWSCGTMNVSLQPKKIYDICMCLSPDSCLISDMQCC